MKNFPPAPEWSFNAAVLMSAHTITWDSLRPLKTYLKFVGRKANNIMGEVV